jgi:hypothetical protein
VESPPRPIDRRSWSDTFEAGMSWITGPGPRAHRYLAMDEPVATLDGDEIGGQVEDQRVGPGRFECAVRLPRVSDVVLKVTAHPFWRATVDGNRAAIVRVFPGFMAVRVPPGDHRLEMVYRPPLWKRALFAFGLAFVVVGSALNVARERRARRGGGGRPGTLTA